jgi:hypothetical protein
MPKMPSNWNPKVSSRKYYAHGVGVSRSVDGKYRHARNSNVEGSYPQLGRILDRVIQENDNTWYSDPFYDCYDRDFLWVTSIQTVRRSGERETRYAKRDRVLERLLYLGVADVPEDGRDTPSSDVMRLTSSIGNRLLCRIEWLEGEVRIVVTGLCTSNLTRRVVAQEG